MKKIIIFVAGAAVGSAVTWKLIKDKYAQLAQEEIDSVKEAFSNRKNDSNNDISKEPEVELKEESHEEYDDLAQKYNYANIYKTPVEDKPEIKEVEEVKKSQVDVEKPYVISPDEFGECYGYEQISLSYHADGVLTDDNYELVEDVDDTVGLDSLNHFGEYEDDSVFVRNDRLKCDYEILLDHRKYSDIIEKMPYLMRE